MTRAVLEQSLVEIIPELGLVFEQREVRIEDVLECSFAIVTTLAGQFQLPGDVVGSLVHDALLHHPLGLRARKQELSLAWPFLDHPRPTDHPELDPNSGEVVLDHPHDRVHPLRRSQNSPEREIIHLEATNGVVDLVAKRILPGLRLEHILVFDIIDLGPTTHALNRSAADPGRIDGAIALTQIPEPTTLHEKATLDLRHARLGVPPTERPGVRKVLGRPKQLEGTRLGRSDSGLDRCLNDQVERLLRPEDDADDRVGVYQGRLAMIGRIGNEENTTTQYLHQVVKQVGDGAATLQGASLGVELPEPVDELGNIPASQPGLDVAVWAGHALEREQRRLGLIDPDLYGDHVGHCVIRESTRTIE